MSNINNAADPRLIIGESANNLEDGVRYIERHLLLMSGFFIVLLDDEDRILYFAGGAQRYRDAGRNQQVISMTPTDLARGIASRVHPKYRVNPAGMTERGQRTVRIYDNGWLSGFLQHHLPTARRWGVLMVGPDGGEGIRHGKPNCVASEAYLMNTWMIDRDGDPPRGSMCNDLSTRMAPEALGFARRYASAWTLAMASAQFFGGYGYNLPKDETGRPVFTPIAHSEAVTRMMREEDHWRVIKYEEWLRSKEEEKAAKSAFDVPSTESELPTERQAPPVEEPAPAKPQPKPKQAPAPATAADTSRRHTPKAVRVSPKKLKPEVAKVPKDAPPTPEVAEKETRKATTPPPSPFDAADKALVSKPAAAQPEAPSAPPTPPAKTGTMPEGDAFELELLLETRREDLVGSPEATRSMISQVKAQYPGDVKLIDELVSQYLGIEA